MLLDRTAPRSIQATWRLSKYYEPHILCMTDALGKVVSHESENESILNPKFLDIGSEDAFTAFVLEARASGEMSP